MSAHPALYSPYDEVFWQRINDERMALQRCTQCDTFRYPPGACCPNCLSTDAAWDPIAGKATVLSWTTFHRQYLPAYPAPTTIVAATLDEGPILLAAIDHSETERLVLDARVRVGYRDHPDGYRVPWFSLTGAD